MEFVLPGYVKTVMKALQNSGFQAHVVGGAVRDLLLGKSRMIMMW